MDEIETKSYLKTEIENGASVELLRKALRESGIPENWLNDVLIENQKQVFKKDSEKMANVKKPTTPFSIILIAVLVSINSLLWLLVGIALLLPGFLANDGLKLFFGIIYFFVGILGFVFAFGILKFNKAAYFLVGILTGLDLINTLFMFYTFNPIALLFRIVLDSAILFLLLTSKRYFDDPELLSAEDQLMREIREKKGY